MLFRRSPKPDARCALPRSCFLDRSAREHVACFSGLPAVSDCCRKSYVGFPRCLGWTFVILSSRRKAAPVMLFRRSPKPDARCALPRFCFLNRSAREHVACFSGLPAVSDCCRKSYVGFPRCLGWTFVILSSRRKAAPVMLFRRSPKPYARCALPRFCFLNRSAREHVACFSGLPAVCDCCRKSYVGFPRCLGWTFVILSSRRKAAPVMLFRRSPKPYAHCALPRSRFLRPIRKGACGVLFRFACCLRLLS